MVPDYVHLLYIIAICVVPALMCRRRPYVPLAGAGFMLLVFGAAGLRAALMACLLLSLVEGLQEAIGGLDT